MPGSPVIYYGEELAMHGASDPDNRRCMEWEKLEGQDGLLRAIKRFNQLRRQKIHLFKTGEFSIPIADPEKRELTISYTNKKERMLFHFNFDANETKIYINGHLYEI